MSVDVAILVLEGVSKSFGAVEALVDVTIAVPKGRVLGLIGPNGSGKTTLFNVITGILPPSEGRIFYRGTDITGWSPERVAKLGIARTFQNLKIFGRIRVLDNVRGAQTSQAGLRPWQLLAPGGATERARTERANELLEWVGLARRAGVLASELPLGEQRRLELARALAREPELLLLDEPAGGMTPRETESMVRLIASVVEAGRTVILIEHKMGLVMELCERIAVLNFGRKIADGTPAEIQSDAGVREAYLGQEATVA